jgi:hypothetical protein
MNTRELMLIETTLMSILQGDYWSASRAEAEDFINNWRMMIRDRGIKFETGDSNSSNTISIIFPEAIALTSGVKTRAIKATQSHKKSVKELLEEELQEA